MNPAILFLIFSILFSVTGIIYKNEGGVAFMGTAGFMFIFSGIYWLFKKGNAPLSPPLGYAHAVFTAAGMLLLSLITQMLLVTFAQSGPDSVAFPYDSSSILFSQVSAGLILFLAGQILFIIAIIKSLGRARKQQQI